MNNPRRLSDMKPILLDTFCAGGGATKGYQRAGFFVVGIDIKPQPHYCGDDFILGDALEVLRVLLGGGKVQGKSGRWYCLTDFSAIHASPPCQGYSEMQRMHKNSHEHPDLIADVRDALNATGIPWVIENVEGAPLRVDLMLCGTMFGLKIVRHRIFEFSFPFFVLLPPCNHSGVFDPWHGGGRTADKFRAAMGIDWLPVAGGRDKCGSVDLAIPPAYTEFIGRQLMEVVAR